VHAWEILHAFRAQVKTCNRNTFWNVDAYRDFLGGTHQPHLVFLEFGCFLSHKSLCLRLFLGWLFLVLFIAAVIILLLLLLEGGVLAGKLDSMLGYDARYAMEPE
jgi:hypothetical protein